jgi:transposase InsO family protein
MPWRESGVVDERVRFVADRLSGDVSMTELCERYGISRRVGYKWLARYDAEGPSGLSDRSKAPLSHGRATDAGLVEKLLELRRARPTWGPRKLLAKLQAQHPDLPWPSHSTGHEILKRAGLVQRRRLRRHPPRRVGQLTVPERPNHVWTVDHKGWVRLGDGGRLEPLTLADSYSRYVLAVSSGAGIRASQARPVLERAFRAYGLPEVIRSDNGVPFASPTTTGLTALSVWWIKLGIHPERITPGRPQENGRLERFHLTLLEAMRPPAATRSAQARRFEVFRKDYNHERPHQALGQLPPERFYSPSPRSMPNRPPEPDYPARMALRRVRTPGDIKLAGHFVQISSALAGEVVAIDQSDAGTTVWFYNEPIGLIDRHGRKLLPIQPG